MIVKRTALTLGIVATVLLTACGGSDDDSDDAGAPAEAPVATEAPVETPPPTDPPVVEIPPNWFEPIPVPEIDGMSLVDAAVNGEGADTRYDLRYDGGPLDAQVVYDDYEALLLADGWTVGDDAEPLIGAYVLDGQTMDLVVSADESQSRLTVVVVTA